MGAFRTKCAKLLCHGRIRDAKLIGKTWYIPDDVQKPERVNKKNDTPTLLQILREQKSARMTGGIYHKVQIDLRTPQEYSEGHIPGSKNVPLQTLDKVRSVVENKDTELFVYCYSGARSKQATVVLGQMGYTNVRNIGGIAAYHGKVESI